MTLYHPRQAIFRDIGKGMVEKNKCNQCDYTSSQECVLKRCFKKKNAVDKIKQNYVVSAFGRWGCCIGTFSWHAMDTVDIADIQIDIHPSVGQGGAMLCWGSEKLVGKNGSNYWRNYTFGGGWKKLLQLKRSPFQPMFYIDMTILYELKKVKVKWPPNRS